MPRKKTSTGKKHKGFYLYSRDLLSSQRYRRCSWQAKGVYLDLLNVLAVQDHPGALCLRDYDLKPRGERSLTQRCLACQKKAKDGEYQSIKYFAEAIAVSASGPRPGLIHGLQELYMRGIIVIVGDTLIQHRMYRDSGVEVTDMEGNRIPIGEDEDIIVVDSPDDGDADPDAERLRLGDTGNNKVHKGTEKGTKKDTENPRVGAGDAHAQSKRVRVRVNNNINNKEDNIVSNGENKKENDAEKTQEISPIPPTFGVDLHKNTKESAKQKQKPVADNPPTLEDVQAYFAEREAQGKPFIYITPDTFFDACEQSGWRLKDGKPMMNWQARVRTFENYRRDHGEQPLNRSASKSGIPVTDNSDKKYEEKW